MPVVPRSNHADFPELPEMTPLLCEITKSEVAISPFKREDGTERQIVKLVMKVLDPAYEDGKIWDQPGFTLADKPRVSRLRQLVKAVLPADASDDDMYAFDTDDLVGQKVMVIGQYKEGDESRSYLRPMGYSRAATSANAAPKPASNGTARRELVGAGVGTAPATRPVDEADVDF